MNCACATAERSQIELVDIVKHTDEIYSFDFHSQEINQWHEGDSSKLFIKIGDKEISRKFSYATLPSESLIRFTTRIKASRSDYKEVMSKLVTGDVLEITEPSGNFKLLRHNRPLMMLSNGVGIAAIRALIKAYSGDSFGVPELVQINVDQKSTIFKDEFDELVLDLPVFKSHYTMNRKSFYQTLDFELQRMMMDSVNEPYVYVVGSDSFVDDVISYLKGVGFTDEDIITDGHRISGGTCGCSENDGCGCGSNLVTNVITF